MNELEKLASLVHLILQRNPVMDGERNPQTARQLVIARVGQLLQLTGSEVGVRV